MIKKVTLVYEEVEKETLAMFKKWLLNAVETGVIKYDRITIMYNEDKKKLVVKIRQINYRMLNIFLTLTQGIILG